MAILADAYPKFFGEGYEVGSNDGFKKGALMTGAAAAGVFVIWQAIDKLPKVYRFFKNKKESTATVSSYDKKIIERLLHLDEYVKDVVESTNDVLAYSVNGRVVNLKIKSGDSEYESDIVFMNNGNYKFSTCIENDLVTEYVATSVEELLRGKERYRSNKKWVDVTKEDEHAKNLKPAVATELKRK